MAVCALLAACGGPESFECPDECECLDTTSCLGPWPSDRYLEDGRVALPEAAMPTNRRGVPVDPTPWNQWRGYSAMTSLIARLPVPIDPAPLPSWQDDEPGLADDSPTVLLDAETGERVAHFAEIEVGDGVAPDTTTLYVRPAQRLAEDRRYVVAIRGLVDRDGTAVPASDGFCHLRDGVVTDHAQLEARRPHFEGDVFPLLAAAGVARSELILAWDFTTAPGEDAWGDLHAMTTDALEAAGPTGLGCTVIASDDSIDGFTIVDGSFTVPLFLDTADSTGTMLRDADGRPLARGVMEAPFRAVVPDAVVESVRAGGAPASVVVYGHGLLDDRTRVSEPNEVDGRTPPLEVAARCGDQVWVATDLLGLRLDDVGLAVAGLTELSEFDAFFDHVRQGIVNTVLLARTFAGQCVLDDAVGVVDGPLVDASQAYYYGNSQGSILGTTVAALSPDIERYALGVGGISYPVMLPRSINWSFFERVFEPAYPERFDRDLLMVMFAQRWDLVEGAAFAPHVMADPLPGMRERPARVLYQVGLHDVQTPNVASEIAARTLGLPQPPDDPARVWGLDTFEPGDPSGYFLFDAGAAPAPVGTRPPEAPNGVHEWVRRDAAAQDQVCAFLRPDGTP